MRGVEELVFSVTNRCVARCRDCPIVHEERPFFTLTTDDMIGVLDEVFPWGTLKLVVFTGGEPFLLRESLEKVVSYIAERGIATRIVTSAYWATSESRAYDILESLLDSGLTEINISCDDYHQEFVPLENVKNANNAAIELGLPALLGHRECPGGKITVEYLSEFLGVELHRFQRGQQNPKNNVILSGPNIPIKSESQEGVEPESEIASQRWLGPCPSVLSKIVVAPDKRVQICCGIASSSIPELYIGSLLEESLLSILERGNRDLITNWLALAGPSSILEFVLSKKPDLVLPRQYVNRCHLCNELFTRSEVRKILAEHASEQREMVSLLRSMLDWFADDWLRCTRYAQSSTLLNSDGDWQRN